MKKIIELALVLLIIPSICFAEDKASFENILFQWLTVDSRDLNEVQKVKDNLWHFAEEFPDSKFADDSRLIYIFTWFFGAVDIGNKNSIQESMQYMQDTVNRYPDGQVEEYTIKKFQEFGDYPPFFLYLPYRYLISYMRGHAGDSETLINNFNSFKDKLDYTKDKKGSLALQVYSFLGIAYLDLHRFDDLHSIAEEAKEKFPDNARLIEYMEGFIDIANKAKNRY